MQLISQRACLSVRSSRFARLFLWVSVPIVAVTLTDLLSVVTVVAVQPIHCIGGCPYPAHLFIDVLAKVSDVKNALPLFRRA